MKEFVKWIEDNNKDYEKYMQLTDSLDDFLRNYVIIDEDVVHGIFSNLINVLANCDEISYEEQGMEYAYVILHFIERYRRFQKIIMFLLREGVLRLKDVYRFLDIGTGPAPAIFAFSDIVSCFNEYNSTKESVEFLPDYVELSHSFRHWLHHFVEFLWVKHGPDSYNVPFHHGTFLDYEKIEFNEVSFSFHINGQEFTQYRKSPLKHQIIETAKWALNDSIIAVIGAPGSKSNKYKEVYDRVDELLNNRRLGNYKFIAHSYKVTMPQEEFYFDYSDKFGVRLKEFYKSILIHCGTFTDLDKYPKEKNLFNSVIDESYAKVNTWQVNVYKKHSRLRRGIHGGRTQRHITDSSQHQST